MENKQHHPSILITSGIFPPESGGPATFIPELGQELYRSGFRIKVITNGTAPEGFDERYPFPVHRISRKHNLVSRYAKQIRIIQREARTFDVLFTNAFDFQTAVASKRTGTPMISKIVGDYAWERARRRNNLSDSIEAFQKKQYSLPVSLYKWMRNFAVDQCDLIITPSEYLKALVSQWGASKKKISVIYNAFSPPEALRQDHSVDIRATDRKKKIVSIGRLVSWKGFSSLLTSFAKWGQEDYTLEIIGEGPMEGELTARAKDMGIHDQVNFPGRIPRGNVLQKLFECEIFILNSLYEGLSHVLLEAMYCGACVVASREGGNPEVISDQENGILVEQGNVDEIVQAFEQLSNSGELRRILSMNAKQTVQQKFDRRRMMDEYINKFQNLQCV